MRSAALRPASAFTSMGKKIMRTITAVFDSQPKPNHMTMIGAMPMIGTALAKLPERQQAALQERHAVDEQRGREARGRLPMTKPASTAFRKVCAKSSPRIGASRFERLDDLGRRRQQDARDGEADDDRLPEIDQRDAEQRGHQQGIEPARAAEPTCAASPIQANSRMPAW